MCNLNCLISGNVEDAVRSVEQRIEARVSTVETKIDATNAEVAALRERTATLEHALTALSASSSKQSQSVDDLHQQVAAHTTSIDSVRATLHEGHEAATLPDPSYARPLDHTLLQLNTERDVGKEQLLVT
eukprot:10116100-Karenia_brevis.AAC.1